MRDEGRKDRMDEGRDERRDAGKRHVRQGGLGRKRSIDSSM
jgi:hypothetical protein